MHTIYSFNFLSTVSAQLLQQLDVLAVSTLDANSLVQIEAFQTSSGTDQGVYVLHLAGRPVYLGKADDVEERLAQHLRKLSGRKNIDLTEVGYKALFLDESMGTAANEGLLIKLYKKNHLGLWNGAGFGPKDPGKERDTTAPSAFDRDYPIRSDFPILSASDVESVGSLFEKMKQELPFVFRYQLTPGAAATVLNLGKVERTAESLLRAAVTSLEPGWQAAILAHGMVLYEGKKQYGTGVTTIESH
ncbi:MAG TPA: hypothetical protein VN700_12505 [Vicinamibacterales bacterium]|nr:hypothetical protein [Vicinamibacterales bacterium]